MSLRSAKGLVDFSDGLDGWRNHLSLFDPDGLLAALLEGVHDRICDQYETLYDRQLRIALMDDRLGPLLTHEKADAERVAGIRQFKNRFCAPLNDDFAAYAKHFGELTVSVSASPHTAMAFVSCAYGEAMKLVFERLEGMQRDGALRAIRMLTSIESDILVSAMHEALSASHAAALRKQANEFEARVTVSLADLRSGSEVLAGRSSDVQSLAVRLSEANSQVAKASVASASAMEVAKKSLEKIAESVDVMRESIATTDRVAGEAGECALEASAGAEQLQASTARIEKIVGVISDIAEQTQILALNAAIEASRAGAPGAGFAVVANEVKNLAAASRKASGEIASEVAEIVAASSKHAENSAGISKRMLNIGNVAAVANEEVLARFEALDLVKKNILETIENSDNVSRSVAEIRHAAEEVSAFLGSLSSDNASIEETLGRVMDGISSYRQSLEKLISRQPDSR